jgi:hypothetical protein
LEAIGMLGREDFNTPQQTRRKRSMLGIGTHNRREEAALKNLFQFRASNSVATCKCLRDRKMQVLEFGCPKRQPLAIA